jgi:hypothetical protein
MVKLRWVAGGLLLAAAILLAATLPLPCQKVNVRLGWSLGLETAPIFETVTVYEAVAQPALPRVVVALLFVVLAACPFRSSLLSLLAKIPAAAYVPHYAWWFWFTGGLVLGRADEVLYGYHVHLWVACATVLGAGAGIVNEGVVLCLMRRSRRSSPRIETDAATPSDGDASGSE